MFGISFPIITANISKLSTRYRYSDIFSELKKYLVFLMSSNAFWCKTLRWFYFLVAVTVTPGSNRCSEQV